MAFSTPAVAFSVGWLGGVLASFYVWSLTTVADKGIALGITAWMIVALLFLLRALLVSPVRAERRNNKMNEKRKNIVVRNVTKVQAAWSVLTILIIGPLAGLAAMMLSTLLLLVMQALGVEYTANLAITSMLFPVFWAVLAVALAYQQRMFARLLTLMGVGLGSFLCLWVMS